MPSEWDMLIEKEPWNVPEGACGAARVSDAERLRLSSEAASAFPRLAELLDRARAYDITVKGKTHPLAVWDRVADEGLCAWILEPPGPVGSPCTAHTLLLDRFYGNTHRLGEVPSRLLNSHGSLLAEDTARNAGFLQDSDCWGRAKMDVPIDLDAYYPISWENSRTTIVHRETEEVLMFAESHSFDHIIPLEGCPERTLYRIPEAPTFREWVETIAKQWLDGTK